MIPWYLLFRHRITVLDLTPDTDTDSVDATIEVSSTFAADFYCEPNISFESNFLSRMMKCRMYCL